MPNQESVRKIRKILEELSLKQCVYCKDSIDDDLLEAWDKEMREQAIIEILSLTTKPLTII